MEIFYIVDSSYENTALITLPCVKEHDLVGEDLGVDVKCFAQYLDDLDRCVFHIQICVQKCHPRAVYKRNKLSNKYGQHY